jgi:tetratricopeptide (TPR) repeat protein
MLRRSAVPSIGQLLLAVTIAVAEEAPVTQCDTLAASPLDLRRKAAGVPFEQLNPTVAIPACENAVREYPNSPRLIYQLGRAYQRVNNFSAALIQYHRAAEQGYASAQNNLGAMYQLGQGVPKDFSNAIAWVRKAAANGDPTAQFSLGVVYESGNGVQKDRALAIDWYRKAAEQGHPAARAKLGSLIAAADAAKKEGGKQEAARRSEEEAARAKRVADAQAAPAKKRAEEEAVTKREEAERRTAKIKKQGLDYASRRESSWQLISSKNEKTGKVESIAISWQENKNGAGAEVIGKCGDKDILFTATVLDNNRKETVELPWSTRMTTSAELNWQGTSSSADDFEPIATLPVTIRIDDNAPVTRLRKHDGKNSNAVPLILFRHEHWMFEPGAHSISEKDAKAKELLKLIIGIEDDVIGETWRVVVQFDTSKGSIRINIPIYDNDVQKMIKSCS